MAAIELIDVGVSYPDGTRALDRVSLAVPDGKVTTVLGPSGSGKSTALKVIAGLVEGSELRFEDRGDVELKAVGRRRLTARLG